MATPRNSNGNTYILRRGQRLVASKSTYLLVFSERSDSRDTVRDVTC